MKGRQHLQLQFQRGWGNSNKELFFSLFFLKKKKVCLKGSWMWHDQLQLTRVDLLSFVSPNWWAVSGGSCDWILTSCQSHSTTSGRTHLYSSLVNWCFEPSQPLGIISGLKENFIKRCIVERTNKAEVRRRTVRKWKNVTRIYGIKFSWKGNKDRNRHKNRIKRSGQAWLVYVRHKM